MTRVNNRQSPVPVPSPPALYHGTDAELKPGGRVVAGIHVGKSRGRFVWMDSDPKVCATYGKHVYRVDPSHPVETCRSAYRSHSATVIGEVTP